MTTTNVQFLALVAKVDEIEESMAQDHYYQIYPREYFPPVFRALKGEIMRHEPKEVWIDPFSDERALECQFCKVRFPCKPWLDMEAEVIK